MQARNDTAFEDAPLAQENRLDGAHVRELGLHPHIKNGNVVSEVKDIFAVKYQDALLVDLTACAQKSWVDFAMLQARTYRTMPNYQDSGSGENVSINLVPQLSWKAQQW